MRSRAPVLGMTASFSRMRRASSSAPRFPPACGAGNREYICGPLLREERPRRISRTNERARPARCRVASGAVAATVVEGAIGCTASVQSLPPAKSAIKRHEALLEQRRRSTPSNGEWAEIPPGLDGSTRRCHRYSPGCVSPLALSAAERLFGSNRRASASRCYRRSRARPCSWFGNWLEIA
jgi:hypothetical protein